MGIHGLHGLISDACIPININDPTFAGTKCGVDVSIYLYKGWFSPRVSTIQEAVQNVFDGLAMLERNKITPYLVFDGQPPETKLWLTTLRREQRLKQPKGQAELEEFAIRMSNEGKHEFAKQARDEAAKLSKTTREINPILQHVKAYAKQKGIVTIQAPAEADATLALLARQGHVDWILTEDSDLIAFKCPFVVYKLDRHGFGLLYRLEYLPEALGLEPESFNFEEFLYRCILSGCDYLKSIPNVGLVRAQTILDRRDGRTDEELIAAIPEILQMPSISEVPADYFDGFKKALNTFKHQVVFNLSEKRITHLEPLPPGFRSSDMPYVGNILSDVEPVEFALGNVDYTGKKTSDYTPDITKFPNLIIWDPSYRQPINEKELTPEMQEKPAVLSKPIKNYSCQDCGHVVSTTKQLVNHWLAHTGSVPDVCFVCGEGISNTTYMKIHMTHHALETAFKCVYCEKSFRSLSGQYHHQLTHEPQNGYHCEFDGCNKWFVYKLSLENHRRRHTGERPYLCDYPDCFEAFTSASGRIQHIRRHSGLKIYTCQFPDCSSAFYTKPELVHHSFTHGERQFKCPFPGCTKLFITKVALKAHRAVHGDERPFVCHHAPCTKAYKYSAGLSDHIIAVHLPESNFTCQKCGKSFQMKATLTKHETYHSEERPSKCINYPPCSKAYRNNNELARHVSREHNPKYMCEVCMMPFGQKDALNRHRKTHANRTDDHICDICKKGYKSSASLNQHKNRTHKNPNKCGICEEPFPTAASLQKHMETRHSKKNKFECDKCHQTFPDNNTLKRHITAKHGPPREKKFVCDLCPKAYYDSRSLNRHKEADHPMDKKHECKHCPAAFITSEELTKHLQDAHKIFVCGKCGKVFKTELDLQNHLETHNQKTCPVCGELFKTAADFAKHDEWNCNRRPFRCRYPGCMLFSRLHWIYKNIKHFITV